MHIGMKVDQARVDIGFTSLAELIRIAYQVKSYQISGPDWMPYDRWDVLAKMPDGASPGDVPQMLQILLAERFRLSVHRESRERGVYALVAAKNGLNLKESPAEETMPTTPATSIADGRQAGAGGDKPLQVKTGNGGMSTVVTGGGFGRTETEMRPDGSMQMGSSKMTIPMLAEALSYYLDRPVIDLTHLPGSYRMELEFSAADLRYAAMKAGVPQSAADADASRTAELASDPGTGISLIASIRRLGLSLEPRQAPIETIVVDHLEKTPTAN
jgi:uncharacterized protein (TIGR03435 family)